MNQSRWLLWGVAISLVGLAMSIAGARGHLFPLLAVGLVLFPGVDVICIVVAGVELGRTHKAASEALGVRVGWRAKVPMPPKEHEHYVRWCEKYRMPPYPFRQPDQPAP